MKPVYEKRFKQYPDSIDMPVGDKKRSKSLLEEMMEDPVIGKQIYEFDKTGKAIGFK